MPRVILAFFICLTLLTLGRSEAARRHGGGAANQSIVAVGPPAATFTATAGNANSLVFTAAATMNPLAPAFAGTWSISGTNANLFNIGTSTGNVTICNTKPTCTDLTTTGVFNVNVIATQTTANGSPFVQTVAITGSGSSVNDGAMTEAPYGGALATQFGSFTWGGVHPVGVPTYYVLLNGVQVDAGDEVTIGNGGNVYLQYSGSWYGPWDATNHFGTSANPAVHLPTIKFQPQTASGISDGSAAGTLLGLIIGKNADTSLYGGNYSISGGAGGGALLGNRIVVGSGGMTAGTGTYVPAIQMLTPGTASPTSSAPAGSNITTASGTWSWGGADSGRPGDYFLLLNGVSKGEGSLMQSVSGFLYVFTSTPGYGTGWYVYNPTSAIFEPSVNPNGL